MEHGLVVGMLARPTPQRSQSVRLESDLREHPLERASIRKPFAVNFP